MVLTQSQLDLVHLVFEIKRIRSTRIEKLIFLNKTEREMERIHQG